MSVSESQTNVVYKVDDRTGPLVNVKKWLDTLEAEAELNLRADCRCVPVESGRYVRKWM